MNLFGTPNNSVQVGLRSAKTWIDDANPFAVQKSVRGNEVDWEILEANIKDGKPKEASAPPTFHPEMQQQQQYSHDNDNQYQSPHLSTPHPTTRSSSNNNDNCEVEVKRTLIGTKVG